MQQTFGFNDESGLTGQFQAGRPAPVSAPEVHKMARASDPRTSKLAAQEFVASGALDSHAETIMWAAYRRKGDPWNVHELDLDIERLTTVQGLDHVKIQKRLAGLEREGALVRCSERKCTHCNRLLQTWDVGGRK